MSRIHEALKKAEQERGLAREMESTSTIVAEAPLSSPAAARESFRAASSPDSWLAQCAAPLWTPQANIAALFSSVGQQNGSEELRTLRSRLNQIREKQDLKTVLITSAMPGEGKTFLTAWRA